MNKHQIEVRKDAIKLLRQARDRAKDGFIRPGRENTGHMAMDCLEDAWIAEVAQLEPPYAVTNRAMAYLCAVIPRGPTDPGSYSGRRNRISKWNWCQYVTQDRVIEAFKEAAEYGIADVKNIRSEQKRAVQRAVKTSATRRRLQVRHRIQVERDRTVHDGRIGAAVRQFRESLSQDDLRRRGFASRLEGTARPISSAKHPGTAVRPVRPTSRPAPRWGCRRRR